MLVALLGERNDVLSASIRAKCQEYQGEEKTVIAILGAAHLNGVQNRLL
jgi:pheromone shutdown protein TraB